MPTGDIVTVNVMPATAAYLQILRPRLSGWAAEACDGRTSFLRRAPLYLGTLLTIGELLGFLSSWSEARESMVLCALGCLACPALVCTSP